MASVSAGNADRIRVRVSLVVLASTGDSVNEGEVNALSNSRRAKASSAHIGGASAGAPGVLLTVNGLRIALTASDTSLPTTPTTVGSDGVGADTVCGFV